MPAVRPACLWSIPLLTRRRSSATPAMSGLCGISTPRWSTPMPRNIAKHDATSAISSKTARCQATRMVRMEMLTQAQAVATVTELQDGERACFWRESRFDRLECLSATFTRHVYAPHTHETYVLGTIEAGCETYRIRGRQEYASVGDLCMVNPDEVHDGAPCGEGYSYRMIYPSVALIQQIASDILDRPVTATPFFRYAKVH